MRIERHGPQRIVSQQFRVVLSERNLRSLLSKLRLPDSACTISKTTDDGAVTIFVSAEPDAQHYADRTPGPMHPATEAALRLGED